MTKPNTIVVEIDGPQNQMVLFKPWNKVVRGKLDIHRMKDANAGSLMSLFPQPVPGQHISLDLVTAEGAILEPLYEAKFAAIRERIESMGHKLPPEREAFPSIDVATSVYWLKSLVDTGKARLIEGSFPATIDESKVRKTFHSVERLDPIDRLTAALESQNKMMAELIGRLTKQE